MQYTYKEQNDTQCHATNLRQDQHTKRLIWEVSQASDSLIIQSEYAVDIEPKLPEICRSMTELGVEETGFKEIMRGVRVRFVSAADKARIGGCDISSQASRYTVCLCIRDAEGYTVYSPNNTVMLKAYCDIPMDIHIDISKEMRVEGMLFMKKEVFSGFYSLNFPPNMGDGYIDGDLYYEYGKLCIPVTANMIKEGKVYIKTETKPMIQSRNKGLKLVE